MANVLLGVTGSVAAIRTPALFAQLVAAGHHVRVVATRSALYFFDAAELQLGARSSATRDPQVVTLDEDEWPGQRYQRGDPVVHIELRKWADLLLIAPLDANTLAKLANGLADNCLTCVWRAWDQTRPVILAPAMNTMMWEHPMTGRHLLRLAEDSGVVNLGPHLGLPDLLTGINAQQSRLTIVPPQSKRLACDDVGMGAMAEVDEIAAAVQQVLAASDG